MRPRRWLLAVLLLIFVVPALSGSAQAQAPRRAHTADAAPTTRTFYIQGSLLSSSGAPSMLVGLAALTVASTGTYTGTLTTGGTTPMKLDVSGTISGTMTLDTKLGATALSVSATSVNERIGNPSKAGPATLAGAEFRGDVMVNGALAGWVTAIDTSALREYSFAASVDKGADQGSVLNGGLFIVADHRGDLQGYFQDDATSAVYPVLSGTLARGQLLVHLDLLGGGNVVGIAAESPSILNNTLVYKGSFFGPKLTDSGTWLSSPPES